MAAVALDGTGAAVDTAVAAAAAAVVVRVVEQHPYLVAAVKCVINTHSQTDPS